MSEIKEKTYSERVLFCTITTNFLNKMIPSKCETLLVRMNAIKSKHMIQKKVVVVVVNVVCSLSFSQFIVYCETYEHVICMLNIALYHIMRLLSTCAMMSGVVKNHTLSCGQMK
jgi:hypothetical protein